MNIAPRLPAPAFQGPNAQDVFNDPSYLLRRNEGQQGIENSAAGRGLVRSGGTLNDVLKYNQGFASNEFSNIWNRDLGKYQENYKTQYSDPFQYDFSAWQTGQQSQQRQSELDWQRAWDQYTQNINNFRDQRDSSFNKIFQTTTAQ